MSALLYFLRNPKTFLALSDTKASMAFLRIFEALFLASLILNSQVLGQITTPCTAPVTNMFTPCMNFLTNSTSSGTSPTSDCCNALKTVTTAGFDCLCLLFTASVPFQLPINRTVAAQLPRACNMPGVPVQCKGAAGAPLPAPGPAALAPNQSPSPSSGSGLPAPVSPALPPSVDSDVPTTTGANTPAIRPDVTPSAAAQSTSFSHGFIMVALVGLGLAMKLL